MKENTRLLVLAGVHGKEDGELGGNEVKGKDNFVEDSERQVGRLTKKFKDDIEKKNIQSNLVRQRLKVINAPTVILQLQEKLD